MCVTRAGRIVSLEGDKAEVRFLDDGATVRVDASMIEARKGSYVEVFADRVIGCLTRSEAEFKKSLRQQLLKSSGAVAR